MINKGMDTYCGLVCAECEYRVQFNCGGCIATQGHPFYGECELAKCAQKKRVDFCGECKEFACELLNRYSFDENEGDGGARIQHCRDVKNHLVAVARQGKDPMGRCGLHCEFCFQKEWCGGCRSEYPICSYGMLFDDKKCMNVECSKEYQLDGCYQCEGLASCEKGYFSIRMEYIAKASALFIQKYGKQDYVETLQKAIEAGYEYPRSFDAAGSVRAVLDILEKFRIQDDLF